MKALTAITDDQRIAIKEAIRKAELRTSGEIRVFFEDHSEDGPLNRAAFIFDELGMNKTALRNGVLIYIAFVDRKFAIIGDAGINERVGAAFWDDIKSKMLQNFSSGKMADGIIDAIGASGEALARYFPFERNDSNELSDDVVFGSKL
ncbi:MAG: TPM domain-containing protein [Bacteroidetes bacterium]|nr:TPM domain-containing protein [Bacteroidota bacterium]